MNRIIRTIGLVSLLISLVFISSGMSTGCSGGSSGSDSSETNEAPVPGVSKGGDCTTDDQCEGELKCLETKCGEVLVEGGPCSADTDCDAGFDCIAETCLKIDTTVAKGGACTADEDCATDLKCIESKCVEVAELGASKGEACTKDEECLDGLKCFGGKCGELLDEGGACSSDSDCEKGYKCAEGKCLSVDFGDGAGPEGLPKFTIKDAAAQELIPEGAFNVKIGSFDFEFSGDMQDSTVTAAGNIKLNCNSQDLTPTWTVSLSKSKYRMTIAVTGPYAFTDCILTITKDVKTEGGVGLDEDFDFKFKSACGASDEFIVNTLGSGEEPGCWFAGSKGEEELNLVGILSITGGQLKFIGNNTSLDIMMGKPLTTGDAIVEMKIGNVTGYKTVTPESLGVDVVGITLSTFADSEDGDMTALSFMYVPGLEGGKCEIRSRVKKGDVNTDLPLKSVACVNSEQTRTLKIVKSKDEFETNLYDLYVNSDKVLIFLNDGKAKPFIDDGVKFLLSISFASDESNVIMPIDSVLVSGNVDYFMPPPK